MNACSSGEDIQYAGNIVVEVSPCIAVCKMDELTALCAGCGRTLNEITKWHSMAISERLTIRSVLEERLRSAGMIVPLSLSRKLK